MATPYIFSLADPRASLANTGGKGASLARMAAAGLPVPGGFHITTAAYKQFVGQHDLQAQIMEALPPAGAADPARLESVAEAIQSLFARSTIPEAIAQAIILAYAALPGPDPAVAVRSSATAEDLPDFSFAGQQASYLNVCGQEGLLQTVKRCWASLWTARAIEYRRQHAIDQRDISLAVVVQLMVPAEAAGILFTANPLNGRRDELLITASWGLGEAVVGGLVTPDTLRVDKASGRVLSRETADKEVMTVSVAGGTREAATPAMLRRKPVLDDQQVERLLELSRRAEALYDMPLDIEWAMIGDQVQLLQARPITALPDAEPAVPGEWPLPDPKQVYGRGSVVEFLPDPLTPLFATLGAPIIGHGTQKLFSELTGDARAWPEVMLVTINGYAYLTMFSSNRQKWLMATKMIPMTVTAIRDGERRWRQEALPRYREVVTRWRNKKETTLSAQETVAAAKEIMGAAVAYYTTLQSGILGSAMISEAIFAKAYAWLMQKAADPPALTFLLGYDSIPIVAEKRLFDIAAWSRSRPAMARYMAANSARQLAADLERAEPPQGVEAADWHDWRHRFRNYLEQHGHAIYNLDFASPTPYDDPTLLLETCKLFLTDQIANPYARQRAAVERRQEAVEMMRARLRGVRRRLFDRLASWAQKNAPLREDGLADLGMGYPLLRLLLRQLGEQMMQAGAINQADEIFWLNLEEVEAAAAALDQGQPLVELADRVGQRQAEWRARQKARPPTILPEGRRIMGLDMEKIGPSRGQNAQENKIVGAGTSPGRVTGAARVLHGPQDFAQMQPGEILVAPITTPAWTPLFAMAAAVVTDVGGPLSHSSIVAREYGIPAVLGTGVATRSIHNGQLISVDGNKGEVILSAN